MSGLCPSPDQTVLSACRRYSTALVLCDQSWVDPDLDDRTASRRASAALHAAPSACSFVKKGGGRNAGQECR